MIPVSRTSRYIIRKLDPVYELLGPLAYPIIRIAVGVMMIPHGYGKLFNDGGIERTAKFFSSISIEPSVFFAWYVGIIEFVGGICVALGLLTRIFSAQLVGVLFVATFVVHFQNGFLWVKGGYEYPLMWMLIMIAITCRGGSTLSIDNQLPKKFIYKDFVKISACLIGSHLVQIILFAFYFYMSYKANPDQNLFGGNLSGNFLDFFYYSINCYTTLGTGDIFANGPMRIATGLEALIGLVLIAWTATFKLSYLFKNKN